MQVILSNNMLIHMWTHYRHFCPAIMSLMSVDASLLGFMSREPQLDELASPVQISAVVLLKIDNFSYR